MSKVEQALKSAIEALEANPVIDKYGALKLPALAQCKSAIVEIEKCEPVAEAIRERDRLGFAVVNVIGKLDEIIENTQEVEVDDFLHIAVPIDMWNELEAALEDMPKRADLYTSPQPIEKCEPVAWMYQRGKTKDECYVVTNGEKVNDAGFTNIHNYNIPLFTSPQPRDWAGLSENDITVLYNSMDVFVDYKDFAEVITSKLKQLNTKG